MKPENNTFFKPGSFWMVVILTFSSSISHSQISFQRLYANIDATYISGSAPTADGGYIISGYEGDSAGFYFFAKLDAFGQEQWSKKINIPIGITRSSRIGVTINGGYYLLATTFINNEYALNLVVLDSSGNIINNSVYSSPVSSEFGDQAIHQNASGEFYISSRIINLNGSYFYLAKADSASNPVWINSFAQSAGDKEHCFDLEISSDGGLIAVGGSKFLFGMNIVKTDINGNLDWAKTYSDNLGNLMTATSINKTIDGSYIVGGQFTSGMFGYTLPLLMKIDSIGNILWTHYFGDTNLFHTWGVTNAIETTDGGYAISCLMYNSSNLFSNPLIIKTDNAGNFQWAKRYHLLNDIIPYFFVMSETIDTGFFFSLSGYDNNSIQPRGYLIKTDSSGNSGCDETPVLLTQSSLSLNISSPIVNIPGGVTTSSTLAVFNNNLLISANCSSVVGDYEVTSQQNNFSVFPNPVHTSIYVIMNRNESIIISNLLGEIVLEKFVLADDGKQVSIDVTALSSGIYFIKAGNVVKKFIKD